jgi:hypothetical protein
MVNMCLLVGPVFNIGGGPLHTVRPPKVVESRGFQAATGWTPRVDVREGVPRLHS